MPALDLIKPNVKAMRVIANVNEGFARELKLPAHIRSLGLITADSDDVTYIAADEATKARCAKFFWPVLAFALGCAAAAFAFRAFGFVALIVPVAILSLHLVQSEPVAP